GQAASDFDRALNHRIMGVPAMALAGLPIDKMAGGGKDPLPAPFLGGIDVLSRQSFRQWHGAHLSSGRRETGRPGFAQPVIRRPRRKLFANKDLMLILTANSKKTIGRFRALKTAIFSENFSSAGPGASDSELISVILESVSQLSRSVGHVPRSWLAG